MEPQTHAPTPPATHSATGPTNRWQRPENGKLLLIAGPCSAESEVQLHTTAHAVASLGAQVLRMGLWKPRTRPGAFEGHGTKALPWIAGLKEATGLELMTEVATTEQVELALKSGFDRLWIGARTTVNPFAVQELAEALRGTAIPLMVKNPINPDLNLWIGALERFERVGLSELAACHRGFSRYGERPYRNAPLWDLSLELRLRRPDLPLIGDPSHIAGTRPLIAGLVQKMVTLGYDGLMIEVHPDPDNALSDAKQQLTPHALQELLNGLAYPTATAPAAGYQAELEQLRTRVDEADSQLLQQLAHRMGLVRRIAALKKAHGVPFFQADRYSEVFATRQAEGAELGLRAAFIEHLFGLLHAESLERKTGDESA